MAALEMEGRGILSYREHITTLAGGRTAVDFCGVINFSLLTSPNV